MDPQGPWNAPGMPGAPGGPMFVHHDAWWAGPLHLLPLVLLAVSIGVLVWGVLRLTAERSPMLARVGASKGPQGPPPRDRALEELRVRYARGEVDRTDYLARSADLGGPPVPDMPTDRPLEEPPAVQAKIDQAEDQAKDQAKDQE
jgi:hypothetical protein